MATRYLSRVLRSLDSVFNFTESQKGAPSDVELDLPVQTVLDVWPAANYGSGKFGSNFGWWLGAATNTHVVTGQLLQTLVLNFAAVNANGYQTGWNNDELMAWIYRVWGSSDDANDYQDSAIMIQNSATALGPSGVSTGVTRQLLFQADVSVTLLSGDRPVFATNEPSDKSHLPMPILNRDDGSNGNILLASRADNAGTVGVIFNFLFWLGPKGSVPPRI